jgi:xanthine dehydrogenase YagR molybdenum-binding subunit
VHARTGEVRAPRLVGAFAGGKIVNKTTAHSQLIGGMIWGVGSALHEQAVVDLRSGAFVNHDLAGYHVPVHADIPAVEAIMLPGFDDKSNALGSKGVGELGICAAGAAVANAIYHACGVRVRDYPITPDKLLRGMLRPANLAQQR